MLLISPMRWGEYGKVRGSAGRAAIQSHYDRQLAFDLFIFGGLFIMSFYHMALYFLRRRIRSNLYFSLLCFFLAIKNLFSGVLFSIPLA